MTQEEEASMHGFVGPDDGPEETVVSTDNEAAERLRRLMHAVATDQDIYESESELREIVDNALAAERQAVVEQVKKILGPPGSEYTSINLNDTLGILDEVSS